MTNTYLFSKANRTMILSSQRQAIAIIQAFFAKFPAPPSGAEQPGAGLVGKPLFTVSPDKVVVQVFYYAPASAPGQRRSRISNASITALGDALTRAWNRTVELRLIRLNHPALDSSILAQYLTKNGANYSFNRILELLKGSLPTVISEGSIEDGSVRPVSHITGIKVQLSGRLTTQRVSPRQTVQAGRFGSSAKGGIQDYSQHTAKNKLGAFTMKVWVSQQSK